MNSFHYLMHHIRSYGLQSSSSHSGCWRSGFTIKLCHRGWLLDLNVFLLGLKSCFIFYRVTNCPKSVSTSEVPVTIRQPSHQASHSGEQLCSTWLYDLIYLKLQTCINSFLRPRPEDPKSSLIHFQHGGSGNWMPLFKRFKLFLKVFSPCHLPNVL